MSKLKYLIIHCLDTPKGREVSKEELISWHTSPKPKGRGWKQVGYSDMIHLDGKLENLVKYDNDGWVDSGEITNGAVGFNGEARHVAVVGGKGFKRTSDFDDVLTPEQFTTLQMYIKTFLMHHEDCKIGGHYQFNDGKECPGFDVTKYLKFVNVPQKNIYNG